MSQSPFNENIFLKATKPSRYVGGEINSVKKPWNGNMLKFALAFPEPYEIGMSHLGFQIIYSLLNSKENILCERVFTPWIDMQEVLEENRIELFSIESRKPLRMFDIIGFSLQYEMSFTNVLSILKLSNIPFMADKRDENYPLIIAGGPSAFNPEPVALFFDAFIVGEAEEAIFEITSVFDSWKKQKSKDKNSLLETLSSIEGVYIPSFFKHSTDKNGAAYLTPLKKDYEKVKRRILADLSISHLPEKPVIPFMKVTHDRISVEIQRGCTKGCRFCQAGMIYRPTRQRKASEILDYAIKVQEKTGFEEISFLSLNSPDHPSLSNMCSAITEKFKGKAVSLSLPSTRLDEFRQEVMENLKSARKTGFTFAPEAGSERLRLAMNKPITDRQIFENLESVYKSGWNLVKLYFMIGLPTETAEDIEAIVSLSNKIVNQARKISKRNRLTVNVSPFVPKPHTPFQWNAQEPVDSLRGKIDYLKANLKNRSIKLKWTDPEVSSIEALLSRGSRETSNILLESFKLGARFDGWSDFFNYDIWLESIERAGRKLNEFINVKTAPCSRLPWDFIETGIHEDFFKTELENTQKSELTPDCAFGTCNYCGLCDGLIRPKVEKQEELKIENLENKNENPDVFKALILHFSKTGDARFLSHLETVKLFERALRRSKIPLKNSEGFHPIPIMKFSRALPIGIESEAEKLLIYSASTLSTDEVAKRLNDNLPKGFHINDIKQANFKSDLNLTEKRIMYSVNLDNLMIPLDNIKEDLSRFKNCEKFVIVKKTKKANREVDLKEHILDIQMSNGSLSLIIDESTQSINPLLVVEKIFKNFTSDVRIKKTEGK